MLPSPASHCSRNKMTTWLTYMVFIPKDFRWSLSEKNLVNHIFVLFFQMKNFLTSVISELPISSAQHRVALAKYSDTVNQEFLLDQMDSSVRIMDHITNQLHHVGGNSNTAGALEWTRNYMPSAKWVLKTLGGTQMFCKI